MQIYIIQGFNDYIIKDKILYRKSHKVEHSRFKFAYFCEREIKITIKDGAEGYFLNGKFYSLKKLRHRLKKSKIISLNC